MRLFPTNYIDIIISSSKYCCACMHMYHVRESRYHIPATTRKNNECRYRVLASNALGFTVEQQQRGILAPKKLTVPSNQQTTPSIRVGAGGASSLPVGARLAVGTKPSYWCVVVRAESELRNNELGVPVECYSSTTAVDSLLLCTIAWCLPTSSQHLPGCSNMCGAATSSSYRRVGIYICHASLLSEHYCYCCT